MTTWRDAYSPLPGPTGWRDFPDLDGCRRLYLGFEMEVVRHQGGYVWCVLGPLGGVIGEGREEDRNSACEVAEGIVRAVRVGAVGRS